MAPTRPGSAFDGYLAAQAVTFSAKKNLKLMSKIEAVSYQTRELINPEDRTQWPDI